MSEFFDFGSKLVSTTFLAAPEGLKKSDNGIWETRNLIKGIYEGVKFPVVFKQDDGKILRDILDTGHPGLYLISDRMKILLEENKLTGWQTYPIRLYDKKGVELFGYHGFSVIGHCGPISYEKSEIIERRYIPDGPICRYYKGKSIEDWDGSDFFTPQKNYGIIVTKRAADILKQNKIANLDLENLKEQEICIDNIVIFD